MVGATAGMAARARAQDRIVRIASEGGEFEAKAREIVGELRRAIGFEAWCWIVGDPASMLNPAGFADVPFWDRVERLAVLDEAGGDLNAIADLASRPATAAALADASGGRLDRSARWREVYAPTGLGDELRAVLVEGGAYWGFLQLHRDTVASPFTAEDEGLAAALAPALGAMVRRSMARRATAPHVLGAPPPGVLVFDRNLRITGRTPAASLQLNSDASAASEPPVPPFVYSMAARAFAGTGSALSTRARFRGADGRWLIADAALLEGSDGTRAVITLQEARASDVLDLVCRAFDLTAREIDVVSLVVSGLDTRGVAVRLRVSQYTVGDHLKSIYAKTGARSRVELVATIG